MKISNRKSDVVVSYYLTKWCTIVKVIQTIGCNASKKDLISANTASIKTSYSSDFEHKYEINMNSHNTFFSETEMNITLTDDGRLKGINQTTSGQGDTILTSAIALGTALLTKTAAVVPLGLVGVRPIQPAIEEPSVDLTSICKFIEDWSGEKKTVTITYEAKIDSSNYGKTVNLEPTQDSLDLYNQLQQQVPSGIELPQLDVVVSDVKEMESGPNHTASSENEKGKILLKLSKMGYISLTVRVDKKAIDTVTIVIPKKEFYNLPIHKARFFGKKSFTLALSDAGSVTTIGYGKTPGTTSVLNVISKISGSESTTEKAAELKAQADLIDQQQRLVQCRAIKTEKSEE